MQICSKIAFLLIIALLIVPDRLSAQEIEDYYKASFQKNPAESFSLATKSKKHNFSAADEKFLKAFQERLKNNYEPAVKLLEEILWFKKNRLAKDEAIYFELALNYDKLTLTPKATASNDSAIKANPNFQPARLFQLVTQVKSGLRPEAIANAKSLMALNPKNTLYEYLLAKAYLTRTNRITDRALLEQGRDISQKIYNDAKNDKKYRIDAGILYVRALSELRELEKAKSESGKLIEFSAGNEEAKRQGLQVGIEIESEKARFK